MKNSVGGDTENFVIIQGFNPIQDRRERGSFSLITSRNVRISPQNVFPFSFNPFSKLVYNFKVILIIILIE